MDDAQVQMWLNALENSMRSRISDFQSRLTDTNYLETVLEIECTAVERKLRNPGGYASESVDNVAMSFRSDAASGTLRLTDDEWARLGYVSELGSANITPGAPSLADEIPDFCDGWIGDPSSCDPEWTQAWPY
jgi:hypothetical protein